MRILDEVNDRSCERVTCFLTRSEAAELRDSLDALLAAGAVHQHQHVPSDDLRKEITVCLYRPDDLSRFDLRSRLIIEQDR